MTGSKHDPIFVRSIIDELGVHPYGPKLKNPNFLAPNLYNSFRKKKKKKDFTFLLESKIPFFSAFVIKISNRLFYLDDDRCVTNDEIDESLFGSGTKS